MIGEALCVQRALAYFAMEYVLMLLDVRSAPLADTTTHKWAKPLVAMDL